MVLTGNAVGRRHVGGDGMRKADIAEEIFKQVGISKNEAADIVEFVLNLLKSVLQKGESVKIAGFGNFVVQEQRRPEGAQPTDRRRDWGLPPASRYISSEPGIQEVRQFVRRLHPHCRPNREAGHGN